MQYGYVFVIVSPFEDVTLNVALGSALAARGEKVAFFVPTERLRADVRAITSLDCYTPEDMVPRPPPEAPRPASDYGLAHYRSAYLPEHYVLHQTERGEAKVEEMCRHFFAAVERFYEVHGARAAVFGRGPKLLTRAFFHVARRHGAIPIAYVRSPFPGTMVLYSNERSRIDKLDEDHAPVSDAERAQARAFLDGWTGEGRTLLVPKVASTRKLRRLAGVAGWLGRMSRIPGPGRPDNFNPLWAAKRFAFRILRKSGHQAAGLVRFRRAAPPKPYVYMPLQYPAESTMTMHAKPYFRQEAMADIVARSLPEGYTLAVKPHPERLGGYPLGFFRRMSSIRNLHLLHPRASPTPLLRDAAAIVVSSGTSGFEGIFYRKPVIVLGQAFYRDHGVTHDVVDIDALDDLVARAIANPPSEADVVDFVARFRRSVFPGATNDPETFASSIHAYREERLRIASSAPGSMTVRP